MRVALLVTDHGRGGTPLRIARLARGLRDSGVDVHVGCLSYPGPITVDLHNEGFSTFACDAEDARDFGALRRLLRHVRRIQPNLIHATLLHANVAARLVGLLTRVPVVTSTATIEMERGWHRWAERLTARMDRAHLVSSVALAEHVTHAFALKRAHLRIIPPSLDPFPQRTDRAAARRAFQIPEHEFVVAWAGRLDPVKRIDLVLRIAEILSPQPMRFLLAGDGQDRPHIEQQLRISSAGRTVHLLGWQRDVAAVLSAADAFLFPSRTEGMPNAVLEAMACGLPIVASDLPVLRNLAGHDESRRMLLVSEDAPAPFAAALDRLRQDEALRATLGQQAADWARANLNHPATVRATLRAYESVLPRKMDGRVSLRSATACAACQSSSRGRD